MLSYPAPVLRKAKKKYLDIGVMLLRHVLGLDVMDERKAGMGRVQCYVR